MSKWSTSASLVGDISSPVEAKPYPCRCAGYSVDAGNGCQCGSQDG